MRFDLPREPPPQHQQDASLRRKARALLVCRRISVERAHGQGICQRCPTRIAGPGPSGLPALRCRAARMPANNCARQTPRNRGPATSLHIERRCRSSATRSTLQNCQQSPRSTRSARYLRKVLHSRRNRGDCASSFRGCGMRCNNPVGSSWRNTRHCVKETPGLSARRNHIQSLKCSSHVFPRRRTRSDNQDKVRRTRAGFRQRCHIRRAATCVPSNLAAQYGSCSFTGSLELMTR